MDCRKPCFALQVVSESGKGFQPLKTFKTFMDIALALILHPSDSRLLIAQRKDGVHQASLWEFPGGKCEPGETPAECAVRETREETGLEVTVLEAWQATTHVYPDRAVTLHPFLCRAHTGKAEPRDSKQVRWVQLEELFEEICRYPFPDANKPILEKLQLSEKLQSNPRGFTG